MRYFWQIYRNVLKSNKTWCLRYVMFMNRLADLKWFTGILFFWSTILLIRRGICARAIFVILLYKCHIITSWTSRKNLLSGVIFVHLFIHLFHARACYPEDWDEFLRVIIHDLFLFYYKWIYLSFDCSLPAVSSKAILKHLQS